MTERPPLIERAFELARSGTCAKADDIVRMLMGEGYLDVRAQLDGGVLRRQLNQICRSTRADAFQNA